MSFDADKIARLDSTSALNRSLVWTCHRGEQKKPSTVSRQDHRPDSKKVGCPYKVTAKFC